MEKKKLTYNREWLKELAEGQGLTPRNLATSVEITNTKGPENWLAGGDIRIEALCALCNAWGWNVLGFLREGDRPLSDLYVRVSETAETEYHHRLTLSMNEAATEKARVVAEMEKAHLRDLARHDAEHADRLMAARTEIRAELRKEFEDELRRAEDRYERKLKEREGRIYALQQRLAEAEALLRVNGIAPALGANGLPASGLQGGVLPGGFPAGGRAMAQGGAAPQGRAADGGMPTGAVPRGTVE